jgi:phosphopantothenoylcysteine decarboxylase/phosphopantothenate--cysteine ligase
MKKTIILGVCGGIAAYKSVELASLLKQNNYDVHVVMTDNAKEFIQPLTFQAISGNPVLDNDDLWKNSTSNGMSHINLSRKADLIVIAPGTANFIAKISSGICDDLLTNLCAARNCELVICPAMNSSMYHNPPNLRNISQLKEDDVKFIGPESGLQACGDSGMGRLSEPEVISNSINKFFSLPKLKNLKILISVGATLEKIDDARAITNISSGKMGLAIANEAIHQGAKVTLVKAITEENVRNGINVIDAISHEDMERAILKEAKRNDIFISVAAVSDYKSNKVVEGKIKKNKSFLSIELQKTSDILKTTKAKYPDLFCVGFAAESKNLIHYAKQKLIEKNLDMIIANEIKKTMSSDYAEIIIMDQDNEKIMPRMTKKLVAGNILNEIYERFSNK